MQQIVNRFRAEMFFDPILMRKKITYVSAHSRKKTSLKTICRIKYFSDFSFVFSVSSEMFADLSWNQIRPRLRGDLKTKETV